MSQSKQPKEKDNRTQRQKFIDAVREHGASEDDAVFEDALRRVAKTPPSKVKPISKRKE